MLLVDTLKQLADGRLQPSQLPTFSVWQRGSVWFAVTGNRRLWVLRELAAVLGTTITVKVRQLSRSVHLSSWFRGMFTTTCDGRTVHFRAKHGRFPSMQMAMMSLSRGLPTAREMLVARELQHSSGLLSLQSLELKFSGQFSVRELVQSKPDIFWMNASGQTRCECTSNKLR